MVSNLAASGQFSHILFTATSQAGGVRALAALTGKAEEKEREGGAESKGTALSHWIHGGCSIHVEVLNLEDPPAIERFLAR